MTSFRTDQDDCRQLLAALQSHNLTEAEAASLQKQLQQTLKQQQHNDYMCLTSTATTSETNRILSRLDSISESLDEMTLWLSHHSADLASHRSSLRQMEVTNENQSQHLHNQQLLIQHMKQFIDSIQMQTHYEELITRVSKPAELQLSLAAFNKASKQLATVLNTLEGKGRSDAIQELSIGQMRAVQEQRKRYSSIRDKFAGQLASFLQSIIYEQVNSNSSSSSNRNQTIKSQARLESNGSIHQSMQSYTALTHQLRQFNSSLFNETRSQFTHSFTKLWHKKLLQWFSALTAAQTVDKQRPIDLMSCPEYDYTTKRVDEDAAEEDAEVVVLNGRQNAGKVFAYCWQAFLPVAQEEQQFILRFFYGADSESDDESNDDSDENESKDPVQSPLRRLSHVKDQSLTAEQHSEINHMLGQLFATFSTQLSALVNQATAAQPLVAIHFLITIESIQLQQLNQLNDERARHFQWIDEFLRSFHTHLTQTFNNFISAQIEELKSTKVAAKRCAVLAPLKRSLTLIHHIQSLLKRQVSSNMNNPSCVRLTVESNVDRLLKSVSVWVESIALTDEKYSQLVLLENNFYLYKVLNQHFNDSTLESITNSIDKYRNVYASALLQYARWHLSYELPSFASFLSRLQSQRSICVSVSDIQYTHSLSKSDLRQLTRDKLQLKSLNKSLNNVYKRVEKHITTGEHTSKRSMADDEFNHQLMQLVWAAIRHVTMQQLHHFDELVKECYGKQESLGYGQSEIQQLFTQISDAPKLPQEVPQ